MLMESRVLAPLRFLRTPASADGGTAEYTVYRMMRVFGNGASAEGVQGPLAPSMRENR